MDRSIDVIVSVADNSNMSIETKLALDADTDAILERIAHGTPLPPDVYQRVQARGDELTEEIRREYDTVEIAVDLVREIRDEE